MASKIIAVTKAVVPAGKRNAGQPYYVLDCFVGTMLRPGQAKACIFQTGNKVIDAEIAAYWDGIIASKEYPPIDLRYVVVGDRESNPNAIPLPPYRVKNSDGTVGNTVHTTMRVLMQFEDGRMEGSPRNQALRIIETMCEPVIMSEMAPASDGNEPPAM